MKIHELKAILNQHPDDAEVGFEHLRITYASYDREQNYLDLGGCITKEEYEELCNNNLFKG